MKLRGVCLTVVIVFLAVLAASRADAGERERARKAAGETPVVEEKKPAEAAGEEKKPAEEKKVVEEKPVAASATRLLADRVKLDADALAAAALKEVPGTVLGYSLEEKGKGAVAKIVVLGAEEADGDRCRVVRLDATTGRVVSVGGLQDELPIGRRAPVKTRGLWEGFEESLKWRVTTWSQLAGLITTDAEKTEGSKALLVQFQEEKEGKVAVMRRAALDLGGSPAVRLDVFSEKGDMEIAVAFRCGRGWTYIEAKPLPLKAGWNRDLAVDLKAVHFKTEATEWEYTAELANPEEIREVYLVLIGSKASGTVYVDNIRIEGKAAEAAGEPGAPVTRLKTMTREELLARSSTIPMADAVKKARGAVAGRVVGARLVTRGGFVFYEVDVLPAGEQKATRVGIDAGTGARVKLEGLQAPAAGGKEPGPPRKIPPGQLRHGRGKRFLEKMKRKQNE